MRWIALGLGLLVALAAVQLFDVTREEWLNFKLFVLVPIALLVAVGCFVVEARRRRGRDRDRS